MQDLHVLALGGVGGVDSMHLPNSDVGPMHRLHRIDRGERFEGHSMQMVHGG
jgi:hypothetical protein